MADVEIKYNNSTIASLNDSGTEVLETNGTFLTDDITVEYTKSGGGGATMVRVYTGQASGYSVLPSGATEEIDHETYDTYINIANDSMFIGQTQRHEAETSGTVTATLLYSKQSGPFTTYYYAVLPGSSGGNFI
jgi:hypothetical protein